MNSEDLFKETLLLIAKRLDEDHGYEVRLIPVDLLKEAIDQLERAQQDAWVKKTQEIIDQLKDVL